MKQFDFKVIDNSISEIVPFLDKLGLNLNQVLKDTIADNMLSGANFFTIPFSEKVKGLDMDIFLRIVNMKQLEKLVPWRYTARLHLKNEDSIMESFRLYGDNMLPINKAFNLLMGRSVNADISMEGSKYNAWLKFDSTPRSSSKERYIIEYESQIFDVEKLLANTGIINADDPFKMKKMVDTLKDGEILEGRRLTGPGMDIENIYIIAEPENNRLSVYPNPNLAHGIFKKEEFSVNLGIAAKASPDNKTKENIVNRDNGNETDKINQIAGRLKRN